MPTYITFTTPPAPPAQTDKFDYEFGSNPLVTTNPPQVGDSWVNTATGEIFICIDATTDDNVWKGTQGNTIRGWVIYGAISAVIAGGEISNGVGTTTVQQYTFSSKTNNTSINSLSSATVQSWCAKNSTEGFFGNIGAGDAQVASRVQKFNLVNPELPYTNATALTNGFNACAGLLNETHLYACGGFVNGVDGNSSNIAKWSTAGNAVESIIPATLTTTPGITYASSGTSTETDGYINCGNTTVMNKFQFSNETISLLTAVVPENLYNMAATTQGAQSETHGYLWAGLNSTSCYKHSFTSDDMSAQLFNNGNYGRSHCALNGTVSGIKIGGGGPNGGGDPNRHNQIHEMIYASDTTAIDVADLSNTMNAAAVVSI